MYLIPYQSGINALSVSFVNQELCHVLCDETKSRLCHFFVFIVEIEKVSTNETVLLLKQLKVMRTIMKEFTEISFRMIFTTSLVPHTQIHFFF